MLHRILITGVSGNLGHTAFERFAGHYHVTALSASGNPRFDMNSQDYEANISAWAKNQSEQFDLVLMAHGIAHVSELREGGEADYQKVFNVNVKGTYTLLSTLVQANLLAEGSLVVMCSSIQAIAPRAGRLLYGSSKAAVEAMALAAAVELAPQGVRVVALRLGQMESLMDGVKSDVSLDGILAISKILVSFRQTVKFIEGLYCLKSITGSIIDIDAGHRLRVWGE